MGIADILTRGVRSQDTAALAELLHVEPGVGTLASELLDLLARVQDLEDRVEAAALAGFIAGWGAGYDAGYVDAPDAKPVAAAPKAPGTKLPPAAQKVEDRAGAAFARGAYTTKVRQSVLSDIDIELRRLRLPP